MCFSQGDRGYEGPKGSRGPPGVGYKGDKVWLLLNMVWIADTCMGKPCDAAKDYLSEPLPV